MDASRVYLMSELMKVHNQITFGFGEVFFGEVYIDIVQDIGHDTCCKMYKSLNLYLDLISMHKVCKCHISNTQ